MCATCLTPQVTLEMVASHDSLVGSKVQSADYWIRSPEEWLFFTIFFAKEIRTYSPSTMHSFLSAFPFFLCYMCICIHILMHIGNIHIISHTHVEWSTQVSHRLNGA